MIVGICGLSCAEKFAFANTLSKKLGCRYLHYPFKEYAPLKSDFKGSKSTNKSINLLTWYLSEIDAINAYLTRLHDLPCDLIIDCTPLDFLARETLKFSQTWSVEEENPDCRQEFEALSESLLAETNKWFSYIVHIVSKESWSAKFVDLILQGYLSELEIQAVKLSSKRTQTASNFTDDIVEVFRRNNELIMNERIMNNLTLN